MSPLACTFLTSKQYTSIQNLYISQVLSAMGCNHTWPVNLCYGDHEYFGIQLCHLESETLIRKIQQLQLLLMKPDTSNLILDTMLAWYQHVSELTPPILERHSHSVNYINSFWINDLVRLLKQYDIEIKISNTHHNQYSEKKIHLSWNKFLLILLLEQPSRNFTHTDYISKLPYYPSSLP